jgi:drug/metabolite transporter (DMT)-like permease
MGQAQGLPLRFRHGTPLIFMKPRTDIAANLALVGASLVWGSTFVIAKDVLETWPPLTYLALRFVIAALVLALLFQRELRRTLPSEWRAGMVLGVLIGVGFALQAAGQVSTSPSKSAFIGGLFVPMVPFVVWLLWRERPSRENVMGVVCASFGGVLMVWPRPSANASGTEGSGALNSGDALTLAATLLFALHVALTSHYARRVATHRLSVCQIAVAAGVFVLLWLASRAAAPLLGLNEAGGGLSAFVAREAYAPPWNTRVAAQILYLALVATVGTFLVGTWGQARVGATHAVVIFSLEPVFATLFAVALRGRSEWLTPLQTGGAVLVFAGVMVSQLRSRAALSQADAAGAPTIAADDLSEDIPISNPL